MTWKIAMIAALALLIVLAVLAFERQSSRGAAGVHFIELVNGERVSGELMPLRAGRYILQAGSQCLLLTQDDIRRIDGKTPAGAAIGAGRRVLPAQETYEAIADSGFVEVHSPWSWRNDAARIQDQVDWGLGEREVPQLQHCRVVDAYGDDLPLRIEDDAAIRGKRVFVTLRRPILPGEEGRLTLIVRQTDCLARQGEQWVYRNGGDYPDDRLVTRAVHLPAGAQLVSVQPDPLYKVVTAGRELIVWRRFFRMGERVPWEVHYRMPSHTP
jgi:hypothetical protein